MGLTLAALTAMIVVAYSGLLQDTKATALDPKTERWNNNVDRHIAAGGAHGDRAQEIKDEGCPPTVCGPGDTGGGGTGD